MGLNSTKSHPFKYLRWDTLSLPGGVVSSEATKGRDHLHRDPFKPASVDLAAAQQRLTELLLAEPRDMQTIIEAGENVRRAEQRVVAIERRAAR